jgi:hypothetical protein
MSSYSEFQSKVDTVEKTLDFENFSDDNVDLDCCCCRSKKEDEIPLLDKLQTCNLLLNVLNRVFVWLAYIILAVVVILLLNFLSGVFLKIRDWFLDVFQTVYGYFEEFVAILDEIWSFLETIYQFLKTLPTIIADFFEDLWDDISNLLDPMELISDTPGDIIPDIPW